MWRRCRRSPGLRARGRHPPRAPGCSKTQARAGGLQPAPAGADCRVGYGIGSHPVVEDVYPYGWGWGWGWDPYAYREGIIAVDLYDAKSGEPLWHASVEQSLYRLNGAEAEKRIDEAVAAIFTKYPG